MKKLILIAFVGFLSMAMMQDDKSKGILDKLSAKMKGMKSFYVEFTANIKNASTKVDDKIEGKGWVKGNKYHAIYGKNTVISNGVKSWTILSDEKSVYEADADESDEESINPKKLMTIWENGMKSKFEKEETWSGDKISVINLFPKDPKKAEYHTLVMYVSTSNNELKKAIMKRKDGTTMSYTLGKFVANQEIEDSKFVYDSKKYPGYKLVKD